MSVFSREWVFADRAKRQGDIEWRLVDTLHVERPLVPETAE